MNPRVITLIIGTRPEAIKLAPVFFALRERHADVQILCTGQHAELLENALTTFGIKPDITWDLMQPNQTPDAFSALLEDELRAAWTIDPPHYVVVQGDTATAYCAAQIAHEFSIPTGHVEAGIRSGDLNEPWPEEGYRREISKVATHHFAPTEVERTALRKEGVGDDAIFVTGNTVIDAMYRFPEWQNQKRSKNKVLVTVHRRENMRDNFDGISSLLGHVTRAFPELSFEIVSHPNPNVQAFLNDLRADNLEQILPMAYPDMLRKLASSAAIMTDSGGLQEEASEMGVPAIVLRERPDRHSQIATWVVAHDETACENGLREALSGKWTPQSGQYGDGKAAARIAALLMGENR